MKKRIIWPVLLLLFLTACAGFSLAEEAPSIPEEEASAADSPSASGQRTLTVLYTNDEHGWLQGTEEGRGAAELMGLLVDEEGYDPEGPFLLISGGDMWTGPAISTWFAGESTLEVMNAMGYRAAAMGNHEFDFGLDTLTIRAEAAEFPFLSANMRYKADGRFPTDIGIDPYTIVTVNDLRVGIIGLTTTTTPRSTNPANVADFEFLRYEDALRDVVPDVVAEDVDLILVPAHICQDEALALAEQVADLPIDMIGGGHCNELFAEEVEGIAVLEGGGSFASYARAVFTYDLDAEELVGVATAVNANIDGTPDPEIAAIVDEWQSATDAELNRVIGYTATGIPRRSAEMEQLITTAWLYSLPTADVAVTNTGGIRAAIDPGEITLADILTVLPFDNTIVEVLITGEQLERTLGYNSATFSGVYREDFAWFLQKTGAELADEDLYAVLVNDFMYAGGDSYRMLPIWDPNGYNTSVNWRQPVIDWIEVLQTSPDYPLEDALADVFDN